MSREIRGTTVTGTFYNGERVLHSTVGNESVYSTVLFSLCCIGGVKETIKNELTFGRVL